MLYGNYLIGKKAVHKKSGEVCTVKSYTYFAATNKHYYELSYNEFHGWGTNIYNDFIVIDTELKKALYL